MTFAWSQRLFLASRALGSGKPTVTALWQASRRTACGEVNIGYQVVTSIDETDSVWSLTTFLADLPVVAASRSFASSNPRRVGTLAAEGSGNAVSGVTAIMRLEAKFTWGEQVTDQTPENIVDNIVGKTTA